MSSKKSKTSAATTANSNTANAYDGTSTSTPNAPSWVSDLSQQFAGQIPGAKTEVSGLSGLQQDAVNGLSGQNFGGMFGDAATLAQQSGEGITAKSGLGGVNDWLNPFLGGVVDATSADLDANDARTRAQQDLNIARTGAFGGSGAALTKSLTEGELERARATTLGGLRMGAFDSAAGNSQLDANRDLQAQIAQAGAKGSAATTLGNIGAQGLGLQADLGGTQRDITQAQLNQPLGTLAAQMGLFGQLPAELLTGQTTTNRGSTTGTTAATGTSNSKTKESSVDWGKLLFGTSFA
jgi:hypothetical protein